MRKTDIKPDNFKSVLLRQLGARILSEANDLKRTPEALAKEMGLELDFVCSIISGDQEIDQVRDFIWKMTEIYPISLADLWLDADDTIDGTLIMRAAESEASFRIFERPDGTGALSEYYEYRDTAMSRNAPFKPEWIKELRFVADSDPNNSDVAFNKGHLMHQLTYFIGAVNFYWEIDGKKHCAEMSTGDSCFITPYVPHSFTRRDENEKGLIIAVTFAGDVRRAIPEIVRMGGEGIESLAGDLRDNSGYAKRLRGALNSEMMTADDLERYLETTGISSLRASMLASGKSRPTDTELETMAEFLNLRPADLAVPPFKADDAVTLKYASEGLSRSFPFGENNCLHIKDLARSKLQPYFKGFDISVSCGGEKSLLHGLHEYVYVYGDSPISLSWGEDGVQQDLLMPGDSAYFQPMTPHRFGCESSGGRLLCVRIPARLNSEVLNEYASFPGSIRQRVVEETMRWY